MFGRWNVFDFGLANVEGEPHLTLLDWHMQRGVSFSGSQVNTISILIRPAAHRWCSTQAIE
jgi:hypothetical protein